MFCQTYRKDGCVSVFSSGAGLQRAESSGDHHHRVRGCPHHAALHGGRAADLEKVNRNRCRSQLSKPSPRDTDTQRRACEERLAHPVVVSAARASIVIPITVIHKCAVENSWNYMVE